MVIWPLVGIVGTLIILAAYLASELGNRPRWFTWANAAVWLPVALANMSVGATWAAASNAFFGLVATVTLARDYYWYRRAWNAANVPVSDLEWVDFVAVHDLPLPTIDIDDEAA